MSDGASETIRLRHAGLLADEVVTASFRLVDFVPRVGELVNRFRSRSLETRESLDLALHALLLRHDGVEAAPVEAETLPKARRPENEGPDLWRSMNRMMTLYTSKFACRMAFWVGSSAVSSS